MSAALQVFRSLQATQACLHDTSLSLGSRYLCHPKGICTEDQEDANDSRVSHFISVVVRLVLFSPTYLSGQTLTSATIVGTGSDTSGAVVANVGVSIIRNDTNTVRTTKTGNNGEYRFPFLKPAGHEVTATSSGLTARPIAVHLLVGNVQAINLTLGLQSVSQSISVDTTIGFL